MSDDLDCSDGAKMLIERMKTNPEEFQGGNARWATVVHQMLQVRRGGVENNVFMSKRDMNALFNAFETYVMETALAEHVIKELTEPKAERKRVDILTSKEMSMRAKMLLEEEYKRMYAAQQRAEHNPYSGQIARSGNTDWNPYV